jgi:nitrile hydratase
LRVRALETLLTEKGYIDPAALDVFIDTYETKVGPRNGAAVVAKAWCDPAFRHWLLTGRNSGDRLARGSAADRASTWWRWRTPPRYTTWSCARCAPAIPWSVLGLPPVWYKSPPYRARAVIDPRGVLAEFGVSLPEKTRIRVWDSTAGDPLPGRADAAGRDGRLVAGEPRRTGHPRFHDRHRPFPARPMTPNERPA